MKVISKQRNSRMCAVCGMDNIYGLQAPFYNMEDGSVVSLFQYKDHHQSILVQGNNIDGQFPY